MAKIVRAASAALHTRSSRRSIKRSRIGYYYWWH